MSEIVMGENEERVFQQALEYATDWCKNHQCEIGAAEMALGTAVIAWGIQHGAITMGKDIIDATFSSGNAAAKLGAVFGGCLGATAGLVLGSVGVVFGGGAVGIPCALLVGAGSAVLAACGYTAGELAHHFLHPPVDFGAFLGAASVLAVGIALMVDGARRIMKDPRVLAAASWVKDGIIHLVELSGINNVIQLILSKPETHADALGRIGTASAAAAGAGVVGASIAAGSVTVLGSHALGAAALSLGLVSAPIWPVVACGAAGLGVGYAAWTLGRGLWIKARR